MSAGSIVTAPTIEIATTTIAPVAIERIVVESTRKRPAREINTVSPEKATATPDVLMAVLRASSRVAPDWISSR